MNRLAWILTAVLMMGSVRAEPRSLVIFHTNDIHGHFAPEPTARSEDRASVGGISALEYYLDSLRSVYPESIYLDAGDLMTGNPVCNLEYNGVKGGALQEMLHRVDLTAECLGNHEFDLGEAHLRKFIAAAPYPLLCANVLDENRNLPLAVPSMIVTVNGIRVGIIGLILDDLKDVVARANIASLAIDDAAVTAQKQIDELDPATDLIVLLTHLGADKDSLLAAKIHGADVIVGGHSHTRLAQPARVNGVVIVQAGSYLKNLGVLRLTVAGDTVASGDSRLIHLVYRETMPRTALSAFADSLEQVIQARYGQVIGELAEKWTPGHYLGSNVGNWVCDRLRTRYRADVALVNAGGLRATWKAGPITMLNVLEMLPFENAVTTFDASGDDLLKLGAEQARAQGMHTHGALEMSGMSVTYQRQGDTVQVVDVKIDNRPVEPKRRYRVVSIDYVSVSQAGRYLNFVPQNQEPTGQMLSDVITDEILSIQGPLRADPAPRVKEIP